MILEEEVLEKGLQFRKYLEECRNNNVKAEKTWEDLMIEIGNTLCPETLRKKVGNVWKQLSKQDIENIKTYKIIKKDNYKNNNEDKINNYKETIEIKSDGSQISDKLIKMSVEQSKDSKFLLEAHGFCVDEWELQSAKSSIWNMFSNKNGKMELYSSKVTVKPKNLKSSISIKEYEDICKNILNRTYETYIPKQYEFGSEILEICLFDVHFAKLAHYSETGGVYDYKIARERFLGCIKKYIDKYKDRKFEKIIFPIGNDFWNSEANGNTANDTRQDNDTRYSVMFQKGLDTLIEGIVLLSQIAPVEVILVQGNHDFHTSFYGAVALKYRFEKDPNVKIDDSPMTRKYVQFGKCLIGFSHGSEEKERIYGLMQIEAPELWGNSKYREFHLGHLHSEITNEKNGIIARRVSSFVNADQWHFLKGYVGAVKKSTAFIWDKEEGLQDISYVNI